MASEPLLNSTIADRLREMADLLELQGANPFRVEAYRRAADTVRGLDRDVSDLLREEGPAGLTALPGIGTGISMAIRELLATGRLQRLERLRGTLDPVHLFQSVPGIGEELARRIHDELHVDTLEALEQAAHDGRLEAIPRFGRRRAAGVRAALGQMLARRLRRPSPPAPPEEPNVATLLDVDREYRGLAQADRLPRIAPKRFNPESKDWLPVLHTERDPWHFTALYSNTARAHQLRRTQDWVVI